MSDVKDRGKQDARKRGEKTIRTDKKAAERKDGETKQKAGKKKKKTFCSICSKP